MLLLRMLEVCLFREARTMDHDAWNKAIEAAAKIAEEYFDDDKYEGELIAQEIRKLLIIEC
jgi:vacuolar-type H+-ATPase subunit H